MTTPKMKYRDASAYAALALYPAAVVVVAFARPLLIYASRRTPGFWQYWGQSPSDVEAHPTLDPHGVSACAWMMVLSAMVALAATRNFSLHRRLAPLARYMLISHAALNFTLVRHMVRKYGDHNPGGTAVVLAGSVDVAYLAYNALSSIRDVSDPRRVERHGMWMLALTSASAAPANIRLGALLHGWVFGPNDLRRRYDNLVLEGSMNVDFKGFLMSTGLQITNAFSLAHWCYCEKHLRRKKLVSFTRPYYLFRAAMFVCGWLFSFEYGCIWISERGRR